MIGERIRQARKMKALSLRALASKAGLSAQAISNYENSKYLPDSSVLLRLAHALDRKIEFFLLPQMIETITLSDWGKKPKSENRLEQIQAYIQEWARFKVDSKSGNEVLALPSHLPNS